MKKDLTELVFILDKSGSMAGLEADTIGGFNGMIQRQKKQEGQALNYAEVGKAVSHIRGNMPLSADWKQKIEEDFEARSRDR